MNVELIEKRYFETKLLWHTILSLPLAFVRLFSGKKGTREHSEPHSNIRTKRERTKFEKRRKQAGTSPVSPTYWLSHYYESQLFPNGNNSLSSLKPPATLDSPTEAPDTHLLATGLKEGSLCSFSQAGFAIEISSKSTEDRRISTTTYPLSKAVAASSAFPGLFLPLRVTPDIFGAKESASFREEFLSDGGLYDNIGIRKLLWMLEKRKGLYTFDQVIVSDAGAPFSVQFDTHYGSGVRGLARLYLRAPEILMRRVSDLENEDAKQKLKNNGFGEIPLMFSSIQTKSASPRQNLRVHPEYQTWLSEIRTDLCEFSEEEIAALVQHGYSVTREQMLEFLPTEQQAEFAARSETSWDPTHLTHRVLQKRRVVPRDPIRWLQAPVSRVIHALK